MKQPLTISQGHLFDNHTEVHYRFHTQLDLSQYPQVHDFYEIFFVTSGVLHLTISNQKFKLQKGSLAFIRPNDIHSKTGTNCSHINLAFPPEVIDALFLYLNNEKYKDQLFAGLFVAPVLLPEKEQYTLEKKLNYLNTINSYEFVTVRTHLRSILFDIITKYLYPLLFYSSAKIKNQPFWLDNALKDWNSSEHRHEGLSFFCKHSGFTKEYICRSFKKYLNMTPSCYLNQQRLNYAVNLLLHSDYSIIDVIYESGFTSASCFYQLFHATYNMTPKKFYQLHNT